MTHWMLNSKIKFYEIHSVIQFMYDANKCMYDSSNIRYSLCKTCEMHNIVLENMLPAYYWIEIDEVCSDSTVRYTVCVDLQYLVHQLKSIFSMEMQITERKKNNSKNILFRKKKKNSHVSKLKRIFFISFIFKFALLF